MSKGNARILLALDNQLQIQDFQDRNGIDCTNDGLCFNDWYNLHQQARIPLGPKLYMANSRLANGMQLSRDLTPLQEAVRHGDLSMADPNWVEVPEDQIQGGDTFIIPGYVQLDPQDPLTGRTSYIQGHIGFVRYNVQARQWEAVSTNVNADPQWNVMPLEQMEGYPQAQVRVRFFHWNGPVRSKP
ncbi:MAG: hypothetical protein PHO89_10445 [Methylacidiphilaceae bacterium]|nr:hypothetical protein [Candidatus Methylacidiphilaceae bacterium]